MPDAEQKPKLTLKQASWLREFFKTGNATEAARRAGFRCKTEESFAAMGYQTFKKLQPVIREWLDEIGLTEVKLKVMLQAGLEATETRFFSWQGEVTETREVIAWETRRRYLDMALKVRGLYAPEKLQVDQSGAVVVIGTGYPDADDALEAPGGPQSDEND